MKKVGTKMLAWHGVADQLVPTDGTVEYDRVGKFDRNFADYCRFFLAPDVTHCGFGNGLDPTNTVFDALKVWIEEGTVPDRLEAVAVAVGPTNTSQTRTGYLCPYLEVFTFTGGDPNSPSSFS